MERGQESGQEAFFILCLGFGINNEGTGEPFKVLHQWGKSDQICFRKVTRERGWKTDRAGELTLEGDWRQSPVRK